MRRLKAFREEVPEVLELISGFNMIKSRDKEA
jgi:hypothetical protein